MLFDRPCFIRLLGSVGEIFVALDQIIGLEELAGPTGAITILFLRCGGNMRVIGSLDDTLALMAKAYDERGKS